MNEELVVHDASQFARQHRARAERVKTRGDHLLHERYQFFVCAAPGGNYPLDDVLLERSSIEHLRCELQTFDEDVNVGGVGEEIGLDPDRSFGRRR